MLKLSVTADFRGVAARLEALVKNQLPYATAMALNATAEAVKLAEQANMRKVLDAPTPFTVNSVAVRKASKSRLEAVVYVRPVAAAYLLPYEEGGKNKLNGKALLKPIGAKVNQYGNLPRNAIKNLLAKPGVFVGAVTFNGSGETINGIWQRPVTGGRRAGGRGTKGNTQRTVAGARTGLRLLVRFADAHATQPVLNYRGVGRRVARATYPQALQMAIRKALASSR